MDECIYHKVTVISIDVGGDGNDGWIDGVFHLA